MGDLPRLSRRRRADAQGHQLRRVHGSLGAADLRDGRTGLRGGGDGRGRGRHVPPPGGRGEGRGAGPLDVAHTQPSDVRRQARPQPTSRLERGTCPREPHGQPGCRPVRDRERTERRTRPAPCLLRAVARPGRRVRATPLVHPRLVPLVTGNHAGLHRSLRGGGGSRRPDLRSRAQPRVHVHHRFPGPPSVRLAAVVEGVPGAPPAGASGAAAGPRAAGRDWCTKPPPVPTARRSGPKPVPRTTTSCGYSSGEAIPCAPCPTLPRRGGSSRSTR